MDRQQRTAKNWFHVFQSAIIIIIGLFLWANCVSVRVITGKENGYKGSDKTSKGIESTINKADTIQ